MAILIGTDEAGYGPNLGPLVISATVWRVPDELAEDDLYRALRRVVRIDASGDKHIAIADSKALYKPGCGLADLERGVLAAAAQSGTRIRSWRDAWQTLAPRDAVYLDEVPWYENYDAELPLDLEVAELETACLRLAAGLREADVSLLEMRSVAVFPSRFNKLLDRHESKGAVLSQETIELVRHVLDKCDDANVIIQCDKHGGRNRYSAILQTVFPDYLAEVVRESREASVYRWHAKSRRVEIRFVAKGESFLPAALASMASKYLRELAMRAFNAFWKEHLSDLKATAGYPVDAKRFKQDIEAVRTKLGIEDRILWRRK
jgi:hypothetical protein